MECFDDMGCWIWQIMGDQMAGGQWSGLNLDGLVRGFEVFMNIAM